MEEIMKIVNPQAKKKKTVQNKTFLFSAISINSFQCLYKQDMNDYYIY